MKTIRLMVATAAAALLAGSAMAADLYTAPTAVEFEERFEPKVVGEVSIWVGAGFLDADEEDFDADTVFNFGGDGRAAWVQETFGLQFEVQGRGGFTYDGGGDDDDTNLAYVASALHAYTRNDSFAFGGYGSIYGGGQVDENDSTYYAGGALEAATFFGNNTLFAQGGGGWLLNDGEGAESHYFGRLGLRHFFTDYTKFEIDGLVGHVNGTSGDSEEPDGLYANWGAEFEHQFMNTPLSVFVGYRGYYTDEDDEFDDRADMFEHVVKLGGTLRWGGDPRSVDHYMPFDAADQSQLLFWDEL